MGRAKLEYKKEVLAELYLEKKLSPYAIGDKLGCSFSTVTNRLKELGIPLRSPAEARMRYTKTTFSGSPTEKAYMFGFAIGDLNTYIPGPGSQTLVVRCHTTQKEQISVFRSLFESYGHVNVSGSIRSKSRHMNTYLDLSSFRFLTDISLKKVPDWMTNDIGWPFFAGYNDAEGNLLLNQGRARLKIDAYDFHVLSWIADFLKSQSIHCVMRKISERGVLRTDGTRFNKDLWRLNVNRALSLEKLILCTLPYTKHATRRKHLIACLSNIRRRKRRRTI